jgi:linearmycin/streptolysin S transport system permease protein
MRTSLIILGKDLRQRLRDRSVLLISIVVPLVLASIFGLIFHNAIGGRLSFKFAVVDQDHGPAARAFVSAGLAPLEQRGLIHIVREPSLAAARTATDQNRVAATFVIPAGLSDAIGHGGPARLTVIGSVDSTIGAQVAESIARSFADVTDSARIVAAATGGGGISSGLAARLPDPISIADVSTKSRQLDAGTFYAAGMAIFFLFFAVQFGTASLLEERRDGTLARMLVAPISRRAVLVGKLLTSMVVGLVSLVVLAVATHFLLSARWGNVLGVAVLIIAAVLAASAVMTLVATLARTPEQAGSWQAMVALVLGMLGGAFFPVAQAGGVLATLSLATPQAWFLRGLENMSGGAGAGAVLGPTAAILIFAAITGGLAFARAGRLVAR